MYRCTLVVYRLRRRPGRLPRQPFKRPLQRRSLRRVLSLMLNPTPRAGIDRPHPLLLRQPLKRGPLRRVLFYLVHAAVAGPRPQLCGQARFARCRVSGGLKLQGARAAYLARGAMDS